MLKDKLLFAAATESIPPSGNGELYHTGGGLDFTSILGSSLVFQQIGTDLWSELAIASANQGFAIGIKKDGTLWSVGNNVEGRTGQGITTGFTEIFTQIGADSNWKTISIPGNNGIPTAANNAVAVKQDGTAWGWGSNNDNQFGPIGSIITTPTQIGSDTDWVDAQMTGSASDSATMLLKSNGTLWSAGSNANAMTGQSTTAGNTTAITQIGTDTDWSIISAGPDGAFAIKTDGTLWVWGLNTSQQLGITGGGTILVPTQESTGGTTWSAVSKGDTQAAALKDDGTRWFVGFNAQYNAGTGSNAINYDLFTQIGVDTDWVDVKFNTGGSGCYGIKDSGELFTWGINSGGQTARGTATGFTTVPTKFGVDTDWVKLSGQMKNQNGIAFK